MSKAFRLVEILWLVVAATSAFEVYDLWGTFDTKFWVFVGFMVFGVFMFFFRKKQRQKFEERNKNI
ncbi:hypothetical protein [Owenweeksia hongkongensis]|uniref:Uncharacterized protein n=1 Tax=Owenweeksia hongkongensis (strain DSM 17368 / CIP 108786 / JCM 12287 / NRRL B-23963 / UST20020801) TaxID=926562 RepID=G8R5V8_OWEHD|nr:hypothetical protein [Owenweeksia hongkongensis]AEV31106.1 hypothetical protein Oweho_0084 [Owenweeksia hongkongensis DSM 17368]